MRETLCLQTETEMINKIIAEKQKARENANCKECGDTGFICEMYEAYHCNCSVGIGNRKEAAIRDFMLRGQGLKLENRIPTEMLLVEVFVLVEEAIRLYRELKECGDAGV